MRSQNKVTEYANGCDLCIQYSCVISFLSISIHHYGDDLVKKGWGLDTRLGNWVGMVSLATPHSMKSGVCTAIGKVLEIRFSMCVL